jgi:hypothetical protein
MSDLRFVFDPSVSSAVLAPNAHATLAPDGVSTEGPLSASLLAQIDRYWAAANYLTVGQIFLQDNPLLREPLRNEHIKPRLLGHWGTSPGLNLLYVHLNRVIAERDANFIYLAGPGHGGPAVVANVYLEGTYTEVYPEITRDLAGMRRLFRQFSTPGGRFAIRVSISRIRQTFVSGNGPTARSRPPEVTSSQLGQRISGFLLQEIGRALTPSAGPGSHLLPG